MIRSNVRRRSNRNGASIKEHREYSSIDLLNQIEPILEIREELVLIELAIQRMHSNILEQLLIDMIQFSLIEYPMVNDFRAHDVVKDAQEERDRAQYGIDLVYWLLAMMLIRQTIETNHCSLVSSQPRSRRRFFVVAQHRCEFPSRFWRRHHFIGHSKIVIYIHHYSRLIYYRLKKSTYLE